MAIIGVSLVRPLKKSEQPELRYLHCKLEGREMRCQVYQRGQCASSQLQEPNCIYGYWTRKKGPTRRARGYSSWLEDAKEEAERGPGMPDYPSIRLAVVGDYVWLPYPYMDNCEAAPFLAHGGAFRTGQPFIKRAEFTPEVVVTITSFEPRALIGGIIRFYQEESVPDFLYDLRHLMPDLYVQAAGMEPSIIDKTPTAAERFADTPVSIIDVAPGTECYLGKRGYLCEWDGEQVTVKDAAGLVIFAERRLGTDQVDIVFVPTAKTKVLVRDERELARLYKAGAF